MTTTTRTPRADTRQAGSDRRTLSGRSFHLIGIGGHDKHLFVFGNGSCKLHKHLGYVGQNGCPVGFCMRPSKLHTALLVPFGR